MMLDRTPAIALVAACAWMAVEAVAGTIMPEAKAVLDQGRWGLIEEDLSPQAIAAAKACAGPSIQFSFQQDRVELFAKASDAPAVIPGRSFAAALATVDPPFVVIELYAETGDKEPALVYTHDPSVNSLMEMADDGTGDGIALYALCE